MSEGRIFNWDDSISNDSDMTFTILDEGDYDYKVKELEKTYSERSQAPMAKITLEVGDESESTTVIDYLVLNEKSEWKLSQFFRSIGLKKHGEPYRMEWDKVTGATGRCKIKIDEYQKDVNGKMETRQSNKIDRYYDPAPTNIDWS